MMLTRQIAEFQPFVNCWQTDRKLYTLTLAWQTYAIISADYHIYYHFITITELQYNYLASKDQNGSGRSAITISLQ